MARAVGGGLPCASLSSRPNLLTRSESEGGRETPSACPVGMSEWHRSHSEPSEYPGVTGARISQSEDRTGEEPYASYSSQEQALPLLSHLLPAPAPWAWQAASRTGLCLGCPRAGEVTTEVAE